MVDSKGLYCLLPRKDSTIFFQEGPIFIKKGALIARFWGGQPATAVRCWYAARYNFKKQLWSSCVAGIAPWNYAKWLNLQGHVKGPQHDLKRPAIVILLCAPGIVPRNYAKCYCVTKVVPWNIWMCRHAFPPIQRFFLYASFLSFILFSLLSLFSSLSLFLNFSFTFSF